MPRMSESEKRKSHIRILDAAARLMREKGVASTSVSDVMQEAGLTHGGFYRHFTSKEDLVAAAFRQAVDEVVSNLEAASTDAEKAKARAAYIAQYLSLEHVESRGRGCPLAAMGPDIAHHEGPARDEAFAAITRMTNLLQPGEDQTEGQGFAIMALLLGTVTLARLAKTQEEATELLGEGLAGAGLLQHHWPH